MNVVFSKAKLIYVFIYKNNLKRSTQLANIASLPGSPMHRLATSLINKFLPFYEARVPEALLIKNRDRGVDSYHVPILNKRFYLCTFDIVTPCG